MDDEQKPLATDERALSEEGAADPAGASLLELILAEHATSSEPEAERAQPGRIDGVVVGRIVALSATGEAEVDYPDNPGGAPRVARAMAAIGPGDIGREAALLFEQGALDKPVVMGLMHAPQAATKPGVEVDGGRVVLSAEKEIVLRCGDASITLTRAGKILIRGAYVLSRASGVQRIQGGSVQIN